MVLHPKIPPIVNGEYPAFVVVGQVVDRTDEYRCIEELVSFVQPLLDLICDYTGMKVSMFAGGPEPADGGRINVIR